MLKGDDTVPAATVRRTGMWLSAIKAKYVTWAREPHLAFPGKQFPTVKIAEQTYQAEPDIVLVAMYLSDRVGIDLQGAQTIPSDFGYNADKDALISRQSSSMRAWRVAPATLGPSR